MGLFNQVFIIGSFFAYASVASAQLPVSTSMSTQAMKDLADRASADAYRVHVKRVEAKSSQPGFNAGCANAAASFFEKYQNWIAKNGAVIGAIDGQILDFSSEFTALDQRTGLAPNGERMGLELLRRYFLVQDALIPRPTESADYENAEGALKDLIQDFNSKNTSRLKAAHISNSIGRSDFRLSLVLKVTIEEGVIQDLNIDLTHGIRLDTQTLWNELAATDVRIGSINERYTLNGKTRFENMQVRELESWKETHFQDCKDEVLISAPEGANPLNLSQEEIDRQFRRDHHRNYRRYFRFLWDK